MGKALAGIIGYAMTEVRDRIDKSPLDLAAQMFIESLENTGIDKDSILCKLC